MPVFEIRPLNEDEFSLWDEFVDKSPKGTLFHKTIWLRPSGVEFTIYGYFKHGVLFAGIPVGYITRFGIKTTCHLPLTPYLGILFRKRQAKYVYSISREKEISQEIARILKKDFHCVYLKFPPGSIDLQPFLWGGFSAGIRYTYIINLDNSLDNIWKSMDDQCRGTIRKAERDGIRIVSTDDFGEAFNQVEKTFTRQNMVTNFKSAAFRYNEALRQGDQCRSFLAKDMKGNVIAVAYIVWDNHRSYYFLGGYDSERSHRGASSLAIWEAIKFTKEGLGLSEFDFGGSMIQTIERFFRKFGGEQIPYYTVSWNKAYLEIPLIVKRSVTNIFTRLRAS